MFPVLFKRTSNSFKYTYLHRQFTDNMDQDGAAPCWLSFIDVLRQEYRCVDGLLHYCRQLGYTDPLL